MVDEVEWADAANLQVATAVLDLERHLLGHLDHEVECGVIVVLPVAPDLRNLDGDINNIAAPLDGEPNLVEQRTRGGARRAIRMNLRRILPALDPQRTGA